MKKVLHIASLAIRILLAVFVGILVILNVYLLIQRFAFKNAVPTVFGYASAAVVSGSMEPEINIGDFVFTRAQDSYAVGDIVMYQTAGTGGEMIAVTHEIIQIDENGHYITKGVNNESADIKPVPPENVVGKVVAVWRGFGKAAEFFQSPAGICILLVIVIFVWFLIDLIPGGKKKHSDEEGSADN